MIPELNELWRYKIAKVYLRKVRKWGTPSYEFEIGLVDMFDDYLPISVVGCHNSGDDRTCIYPGLSKIGNCGRLNLILLDVLEQELGAFLNTRVSTLPWSKLE